MSVNILLAAAVSLNATAWLDYNVDEKGSLRWWCTAGNVCPEEQFDTPEAAIASFLRQEFQRARSERESLEQRLNMAEKALASCEG